MASLCSAGQDASNQMQVDLLWPPLDLKFMWPVVTLGQSLNLTSTDAARREQHDGVRIIAPQFIVENVFTKIQVAVYYY